MNPFDPILEVVREAVDEVFKPALARLTDVEAAAVLNAYTSNQTEQALDIVRSRMTGEELTAEKRILVDQLKQRVGDEAALKFTGQNIAALALRTAIAALFAAL